MTAEKVFVGIPFTRVDALPQHDRPECVSLGVVPGRVIRAQRIRAGFHRRIGIGRSCRRRSAVGCVAIGDGTSGK